MWLKQHHRNRSVFIRVLQYVDLVLPRLSACFFLVLPRVNNDKQAVTLCSLQECDFEGCSISPPEEPREVSPLATCFTSDGALEHHLVFTGLEGGASPCLDYLTAVVQFSIGVAHTFERTAGPMQVRDAAKYSVQLALAVHRQVARFPNYFVAVVAREKPQTRLNSSVSP